MSVSALTLLLVAFAHLLTNAKLDSLRNVFEWKELDFDFPNNDARQRAIHSGNFVPGNSVPVDVQLLHQRLLVTMPRWKDGIPATVATMPSFPKECGLKISCSPLLRPFPDWSWNNGDKGCTGLTSVFRVNLDKCGRLWVIDSGVLNILTNKRTNVCPPQLLSFDHNNETLIRRYIFPNTALKTDSLLVTVALDTISKVNKCENTYAYSADVSTYALLVTDTKRGNSWRVENRLFYPYPNWGRFNISGESIDIMDGVISLAVEPTRNPAARRLFFHSLASARENYVSTLILHNASQDTMRSEGFYFSEGQKPSQAAASAFDSEGILFFGLLSKNSLACWNPSKPHTASNIIEVAKDNIALQFASGVKVDNEDNVWMLTSRLQSYFRNTINPSVVNFRIMIGSARKLTRGTICENEKVKV